eukprot:TRINITY_DN1706_c0_g1_i1.p1 TRINITY_DN1706_c0_g1~~TRINITY_DN1706_c0_g1_i1.p1  ORF type:complete len:370 (+),score=36.30 TRINITY_DN1706_c0_g1_i1:176-1285(+)
MATHGDMAAADPHMQQALLEEYPPAKRTQFTEPMKFLPVFLVSCTILGLYALYTVTHCLRLLQLGLSENMVDQEQKERGIVHFALLNGFTFMLLVSYLRSIFTNPGEVPDHDPRWQYEPTDNKIRAPEEFCETKKSGERRDCKWCAKFKPDRAHHCRSCTTCVLKMDHHCPWIYNCIGYYNYKYFFLTLVYAVCSCQLIAWTMIESSIRTIEKDDDFLTMFGTIFGQTLSFSLGFLLLGFLGFHCWLVSQSITTIEWCENKMRKEGQEQEASPYDQGPFKNFQETLGWNPLLWLLPIGGPPGDGLEFAFDSSRLGRNIEAGRKIQRDVPVQDDHPFNPHTQANVNVDYDGHVYASHKKRGIFAGHGFAG